MLLQYHDYLLEQSIDDKFFKGLDEFLFINKKIITRRFTLSRYSM